MEYAGDIRDAGRHLLELINDILDLAKVEAGHLKLNDDLLETQELVQSCLAMVRGAATEAGQTLTLSLPAPCPRLYVDGRKLKQILVNLLSNAVKFTPRGGRIELRGAATQDKAFAFTVTDSGIGIAPEERSKVLEPFAHSAVDLHSGKEGAGLGLSLTKALVELHGGTLSITGAEGSGTRVTVLLPRHRIRYGTTEAEGEESGDAHVA